MDSDARSTTPNVTDSVTPCLETTKESGSRTSQEIKTKQLPPDLMKWEITEKEKHLITQLKEKLKDALTPRYHDIRLCRFLRARNHELLKTEIMILKEMKWREATNPEKIVKEFPSNRYYQTLIDYWPGRVHGVDKAGIPIYCERIAAVDPSSLLSKVPRDVLLMFHIFMMEKQDQVLDSKFLEYGCPVGYIYVMDVKGLGMKHYNSAGLDILKEITQLDDSYYPEGLRKFFVLNCPRIFSMFWAVAKLWLNQNTIDKFSILKSEFLPDLLNHINCDQLPKYLGGSCANVCEHLDTNCAFGGDKFKLIDE